MSDASASMHAPFQNHLKWRRFGFLALTLTTAFGLLAMMYLTLFTNGPDIWGALMLLCFTFTLPWTVIGFWHAVIGLTLLSFTRQPLAHILADLKNVGDDEAINCSTALAICVRNENIDRLERNIGWMLNALVKTTYAPCFHLYILSDTDDPSIARAEAKLTDQMQQRFGSFIKITYRQRQHHHGFKAGNLRDFCERWGTEHDYLIVLDADSVMSAASLLRLVRIMQANAQLGIVQTLVTALPTSSAFARIFQFGMRLGMRSYTFGGASWQGDCGPYWGHNAIIRLAPFVSQCELPLLAGHPPLGGHLLSHDQVEAVLMRRAGYEVRVLPLEDGSYEENPPTLLEFIRRDLRWCQGNMQYFKLLSLPNLYPVSRLQLVLAILMYVSAPAWLGFMFFGLIRHQPFHAELGAIMLMISLFMSFAPKCATLAAIMLDAKQRHAFGGRLYLIIGAIVEFFFSLLIVPIAAVSVSLFTLGLPFGRKVGWTTQLRDSEGLPWRTACQALWFHTLIGCGFVFWLAIAAPAALWIGAPFYSGLILSIPFAIFTAHPRIGEIAARYKLCAIPEELFAPDPTADALFNPLRTKPSPTPQ